MLMVLTEDKPVYGIISGQFQSHEKYRHSLALCDQTEIGLSY
jgi:hypothetical protein